MGGGVEKTENFHSRRVGWFLNCFFLSFSSHENYSIKNICVYSKSKIKTKSGTFYDDKSKIVISQVLQQFKTVAVILLGNIYESACVFVFTKRQLFFVWVLLFFVSTNFSIHSYLVHKSKNTKQLCYKDWEGSVMLYYLFWYNKSQSRSFLIQLETTMQWFRKFEQKIICDEKL